MQKFPDKRSAGLLALLQDQRQESHSRLVRALERGGMPDSVLHEFACDCAERLRIRYLGEYSAYWEWDRCWAAICVKRSWLRGKASEEELIFARNRADASNEQGLPTSASFAAAAAAGLAAYPAALAASMLAIEDARRSQQEGDEIQWQISHLCDLLGLMLGARGRVVSLLHWRHAQHAARMASWHGHWEEVLF